MSGNRICFITNWSRLLLNKPKMTLMWFSRFLHKCLVTSLMTVIVFSSKTSTNFRMFSIVHFYRLVYCLREKYIKSFSCLFTYWFCNFECVMIWRHIKWHSRWFRMSWWMENEREIKLQRNEWRCWRVSDMVQGSDAICYRLVIVIIPLFQMQIFSWATVYQVFLICRNSIIMVVVVKYNCSEYSTSREAWGKPQIVLYFYCSL